MINNPYYNPYWVDVDLDSLEHYGILGMKWGVRRTPEQLGRKPKIPTEKRKYKRILNRTLSLSENIAGASHTKIKEIKDDKTLTNAQKFAKRMVNVPGFEMEEIVAFQNADSIISNMKRQNKDYKNVIPDNARQILRTSPWKEIAEEVAARNNIDMSTPEGEARMSYVMLYWPHR